MVTAGPSSSTSHMAIALAGVGSWHVRRAWWFDSGGGASQGNLPRVVVSQRPSRQMRVIRMFLPTPTPTPCHWVLRSMAQAASSLVVGVRFAPWAVDVVVHRQLWVSLSSAACRMACGSSGSSAASGYDMPRCQLLWQGEGQGPLRGYAASPHGGGCGMWGGPAVESTLSRSGMLECDLHAKACANLREGDKEGNHDWFPNNINRSHTFPLTVPWS
jgi:hypothetical protein